MALGLEMTATAGRFIMFLAVLVADEMQSSQVSYHAGD
jgi:hypothetical protein